MTPPVVLIAAVVVLAAGTFAMRVAGPVLRTRVRPSADTERLLAAAAVVLLAALVGTSALFDGAAPAGLARSARVAVGGVLTWRGAPFVVVVLVAAITAGCLRLVGVT